MMTMTTDEARELEKQAELNDGHCSNCHQTIKIYRYRINKTHASFMKAMANAVRDTEVNDVDISTIGIAYSTRTQVSKIRQHGLIARIKDERGVQIPRRWLITHKGWEFLNGQAIAEKVVIYNNQVLGHEGNLVNIFDVLGERFDPQEPIYAETPVSEPEARILDDVRQPQSHTLVTATFKGRDYHGRFRRSQTYELKIKRLQMGKPVEIIGIDGEATERRYSDVAAFQRDWRTV